MEKTKVLPLEYFEKRDFTKPSWKIRDYINDKNRFEINLFPKVLNFNNTNKMLPVILENKGYDTVEYSVKILGDFDLLNPERTIIAPNEKQTFYITLKDSPKINGYFQIEALNVVGNNIVNLFI